MEPYDELQSQVGAALAEIQRSVGPESQLPAHHPVTELRVHPSGEVVVRIGHPVQVSRLGGASPAAEPAPPEAGPYDAAYCASQEPSPWTPPVQSMEPPAFSVSEEQLLVRIQTATSLTREQLIGHLLRRALAAEARKFAAEQGLHHEPVDPSARPTSSEDMV